MSGRWTAAAMVGLLALVAAGCEPESPTHHTDGTLASALDDSGLPPLSAAVTVDIAPDGLTAVIHLTNTTPDTSSTVPGAPILTRFGFNLADGPTAKCLVIDPGSYDWSIPKKITPFCGIGGKKKGDGGLASNAFMYGIDANKPAPKTGLEVGETIHLTLSVDPACGPFQFTSAMFDDAPMSPTGGHAAPWAVKLQVVGENGEDSGCAGDGFGCHPKYRWSEFISTAADLNGLASNYKDPDSRAGSVEVNTNGGWPGFNGITDDRPFDAAIITLRNGVTPGNGLYNIVEQWLINRVNTPVVLPADGCRYDKGWPECWIDVAFNAFAAVLVPKLVDSSNVGFDDPPTDRVQIGGGLLFAPTGAMVHTDNTHQTLIVGWYAPLGIETALIQLRGRYDDEMNGLGGDDPLIVLFQRNYPGQADFRAIGVNVIADDGYRLIIKVNVETALQRVCERYASMPGFATVNP